MISFLARNVNEAFSAVVKEVNAHLAHYAHITQMLVESDSRNGPVYQFVDPVCITYMRPYERVLFNPGRDANPFFHLFESLWMLAGRNDLAPLQYYVSTFDQFSDDGKILNGAYGYRWRNAYGGCNPYSFQSVERVEVDQLTVLIEHLAKTPNSRRAVLQMWNVEDDLLKINTSKDVCCNLCIGFSRRVGHSGSYLGEVLRHDSVQS